MRRIYAAAGDGAALLQPCWPASLQVGLHPQSELPPPPPLPRPVHPHPTLLAAQYYNKGDYCAPAGRDREGVLTYKCNTQVNDTLTVVEPANETCR